jgi:hypothetical protein
VGTSTKTVARIPSVTRISGLALVSILALAIAGCGKTYSYKYRITVAVRDHDRLLKSSNVVLVTEESVGTHAKVARSCGEASVVKLSNGKYLLALLMGAPLDDPDGVRAQWRDAPTNILLHRLKLPTEWSYSDDSGIRKLPDVQDVVQLSPYEMPEFVSFNDVNDPTTVARVDPKNLPLSLGSDVRIEGVSVQVTDEEMTRGHLTSVIPWLHPSKDYLDGSRVGGAVKGYHSYQFAQCK